MKMVTIISGVAVLMAVVATPAALACDHVNDAQKARCESRYSAFAAAVADDGTVPAGAFRLAAVREADAADRGWLGVQLGEVPEPLAVHLGIEQRGVIVLNVVEDSPAAQAQLAQHDIIVALDGQPVDGDIPALAEAIGTHAPSDFVTLTILRNGVEQTLSVQLGERPETTSFDWEFEFDPKLQFEDKIETRGRVMMRAPDGEWMLKDLGDLSGLGDLQQALPGIGSKAFIVNLDGDRKSIKVSVQNDGGQITVEQSDGGPITVTRVDKDGHEAVSTYQSADELQAQDEEAYNLYNSSQQGPGTFELHLMDLDGDMQHLHEQLRKMTDGFNTGDFHFSMPEPGRLFMGKEIELDGLPPKYSFSELNDGSIEVRIRKSDSELVKVFSNLQDMQSRAPELAQRYQSLSDAAN